MERTKFKAATIPSRTEPMVKLETKTIDQVPEIVDRPKLRYRKIGGGILRIFGKSWKAGAIIEAYPEQIPEGFKDTLVCISDTETQKKAVKTMMHVFAKETLYEVIETPSKGWFDVVNSITRKPLNEKTLRQEDAIKLCNAVNT